MWTASTIRRHFSELPENTPVSRKELLLYGTQDAVDSALRKLLKNMLIVRVACGMYLRPSASEALPSAASIAEARIAAFYRTGVASARTVARAHGLVQQEEREIVFEVNAASSSFKIHESGDIGSCIVILRSRVARKMHLEKSAARRAIKALWFMREENVTPQLISAACRNFGRDDRIEFRASHRFMPGWMSDTVHSMNRTELIEVGSA